MATTARSLLRPYNGKGLFITGIGTDVGKTMVTAALAAAFHRLHLRVGICKPLATGCPKFPNRGNDPVFGISDEDLQSPDAVMAARAAGLDPTDESLLRYLSPLRYAVAAAPAVAARIEKRPPDWRRVESALDWWQENSDVLLIEGVGGWYVPLDENDYMVADLAASLRLPVLVVTHAALGTLNATLLTVHAIQSRNLPIIGMAVNRVPDEASRDLATDNNLHELPRLTGLPVRAELPEMGQNAITTDIPESFVEAVMPFAREWWELAQRE